MFYTKEHEWFIVDSNEIKMGISKHASDELGDITYVELPEVGAEVTAGKSFIVIESVKAASDIYAPVSGVVVSVNEELEDSPEIVNEDAENKGWLCTIKYEGNIDTSSFMNQAAYLEFLQQ